MVLGKAGQASRGHKSMNHLLARNRQSAGRRIPAIAIIMSIIVVIVIFIIIINLTIVISPAHSLGQMCTQDMDDGSANLIQQLLRVMMMTMKIMTITVSIMKKYAIIAIIGK